MNTVPEWIEDWSYDDTSCKSFISNWGHNNGVECYPINNEPDKVFSDPFPSYNLLFNTAEEEALTVAEKSKIYSDNIITALDKDLLSKFTEHAVSVAIDASSHATNITDECIKAIASINDYDKNYLGVIDEEIINYNEDTSDDDLIFPNLNYLTTF